MESLPGVAHHLSSPLLPRPADADDPADCASPSARRHAYAARRAPSPRPRELPHSLSSPPAPAPPPAALASSSSVPLGSALRSSPVSDDTASPPSPACPVLCAFHFSRGVAAPLHPSTAASVVAHHTPSSPPPPGSLSPRAWTWVHLKRDAASCDAWLRAALPALDAAARDELTSDDDAPRCGAVPRAGRALALRLRGLHRHTQPGALEATSLEQYNDLYAISLVITPFLVLSASAVSLEAVRHARELLRSDAAGASQHPLFAGAAGERFSGDEGRAAAVPSLHSNDRSSLFGDENASSCSGENLYECPGDFVAQLVEWLMADAAAVVAALQDDLDAFEIRDVEEPQEAGGGNASHHGSVGTLSLERAVALLSSHRRMAVKLRRWVGPHRGAIRELADAGAPWLFAGRSEAAARLRCCADATASLLDQLEASKEQALVLKDELHAVAQSRANHALYLLSVISALFLPFSFVTGLLSMSIGGIPGKEDPRAFRVVTLVCIVLLAAGCALFRRLRWL